MSDTAQLEHIVLIQEPEFRLGRLKVCPARRVVIADDRREVLQPRIMQVLVALARRRGEVVSRDDLIAACWGGYAVSDDAIQRCVGRIRRLAEAHGGFSLETVPRVGYQLTEDVGSVPLGALTLLRNRALVRVAVTLAIAVVLLVAGYVGGQLL